MTKSEFDTLIKENLVAQFGPELFGYHIPGTDRTYGNYYNDDAFSAFKKEMQSSPYAHIYHSYNRGKGSELKELPSRYGILPPKMASVASSSRFCYLALRDGAAALGTSNPVIFECGCPITGVPGNAPQLDACIPADSIYVEAKCHEIFDSHRVVMKNKYHNLIHGTDNAFGFEPRVSTGTATFEIPLSAFGIEKDSSMFDIKQLLCHLMGIASQTEQPATLVYLFFIPKTTDPVKQKAVDDVFNALREEIRCIFNSAPIRNFCTANQITLRAVAENASVMEPLSHENLVSLI